MAKFIVSESRLEFEFEEDWRVFQFDKHRDYREHIQKQVQGTDAIDFLGIYANTVYLIEVKNFRNHRLENQQKLLKGHLHEKVGQKVRDSVACIVGAARNSSEPEFWRPFLQMLCDSRKVVKVVLWLEYDLPPRRPTQDKVRASVRTQEFKKKLKWLTSKVLVCNLEDGVLPDVRVSNLPGAAGVPMR